MKRLHGMATVLAAALVLGAGACSSSTGEKDPGSQGFSIAILEPDHLTPGRTSAYQVMQALFAPLVSFDAANRLVNVQSESVTSTDNKVWTIKLKAGWKFHNGEAVTAQSYADAWNATAYGPNAWAFNASFVNVAGYAALNPASGKPATKTLSGLTVADDTTLRVTLTKADSQFPYQLGGSGFLPLPRVAFENPEAYDIAPVGDGPFQLNGTWQRNVQLMVKRYDGYQGAKAKSASVTFKIYSNLSTAYTDAQGGAVDVVSVPQEKLTQVKSDFGDRVIKFDAVSVDLLGVPLWDRRYADPRVRQAMSLAIDREAMNKALFGGFYTPAKSLTPATAVGGGGGSCGDFCAFDPARAKQLLAAAGGFSGTMEIWFPGGVGYDATFEAVANQLRQNLGVADVRLKAVPDFAEYLQNVEDKSVAGPFRVHWGSPYPSMQSMLTALFTRTGLAFVATRYSSAQADTLIAAGNAAAPEQAAAQYQAAETAIMKDFPVVPLFYAPYVYAHSERVGDVVVGHSEVDLAGITAA